MDKGAYNHHRNGEEHYGKCHDEDASLLPEGLCAELSGNQPSEYDIAQDGAPQDIHEHEDAGKHHNGAAPFRLVHLRLSVSTLFFQRLIFGVEVFPHPMPLAWKVSEQTEVIRAGVDEDALLKGRVLLLGIVIHAAYALRQLRVVLVVLLQPLQDDFHVAAQVASVGDAHGTVLDALLVQHEGRCLAFRLVSIRASRHLDDGCEVFLKVIGRSGHRRRQLLQRINQAVVTGYFRFYVCLDLVEGHGAALQLLVEGGGLLACVCHVEREVLPLRIEHQTGGLRPFDDVDELIVLPFAALLHLLHQFLLFVPLVVELQSKHVQRMPQVFLLEHGMPLLRNGRKEQ